MPENRKSVRHDVKISVTITIDGTPFETVMQNLSVGGALISYKKRVELANRVQVTFRIPTNENEISIGSTVRWCADGVLGVQFDGLRAREVWSLNKYFDSLPD